jgi:hypothetical protein
VARSAHLTPLRRMLEAVLAAIGTSQEHGGALYHRRRMRSARVTAPFASRGSQAGVMLRSLSSGLLLRKLRKRVAELGDKAARDTLLHGKAALPEMDELA